MSELLHTAEVSDQTGMALPGPDHRAWCHDAGALCRKSPRRRASGRYDEDCAEAKRISECDTHSGRVARYAPDRPMPRVL